MGSVFNILKLIRFRREKAKFIIEKIKDIKPGALYPDIVEWLEGYQVLLCGG